MIKGLPGEWGTCLRMVALGTNPGAITSSKDTVAVGLCLGDIIILNAIIGSQVAVLSGHTSCVRSLTFSLDGRLLVSASRDRTVKLWDIQTGGVIRTHDHPSQVHSVSISPDSTTIASGCQDSSIYLWGAWTGVCFCVINGHNGWINSISFSPVNSQHLISASGDHTIKQWNINGCQIGPTHEGDGVTFSLDGTHFVSWREEVATVQYSESGVAIARLQAPRGHFFCCCFSPGGELVVGGAGCDIYVWDITYSDPHLIKTFVGHIGHINDLTLSSSLISVSDDKSAKFWQISPLPTGPGATSIIPTPPTSAFIVSVSLQEKNGIAISSDSAGVVKTWDILTGLCKTSFQTPAEGKIRRDIQLVEGRLILVCHTEEKIHIWDVEQGELLRSVDVPESNGLRISGDGSKIFCLTGRSIQSWCMQTGEAVGRVELENCDWNLDSLIADGSRIWVCSEDSSTRGWDFGISTSYPTPLSNTFPDRPQLNFIDGAKWVGSEPSRIKDTVTGKEIFQLVGRYADPYDAQWDGRYLVAGYMSGEVLILDFNHMVPQ